MADGFDSSSSVDRLFNDNAHTVILNASEILLKFANNVLNSPAVEKYRKIRVGNPVVSSKLLNVTGAVECLFEMGFEEVNTVVILLK